MKSFIALSKADQPKINELLFINEGFSFYFLIFNIFWLIYHRLWLGGIIYLMINYILYLSNNYFSSVISVALNVIFLFFAANFANHYLIKQLMAKGYKHIDLIIANSEDEAKLRFLDRHHNNVT